MPAYSLGKNAKRGQDLTLPSGATCLARMPGPQTLIAAGVLDSLDSLTALVGKKINELSGEEQAKAVRDLAARSEDINRALNLIDQVTEYVVIEPKVLRPVVRDARGVPVKPHGKEIPLPEAERDPEQVYTDMIEMEDKTFLLNYAVGGSADLNAFRQGTADLMGSVEDGEGVQLPS